MRRFDAVVVGAGAMGSSAAWWLARQGRSVLLVEQFEQHHHRGSSHGGVRIFRLAYSDLHYVRMAQAAVPLWRELEDDTGETLLEITGGFDHGPPGTMAPIAAALGAAGARFERIMPAAAAARSPGLVFDADVLFHPMAGRAYADRTVAALQRRVGELGGEVRFSCPAAVQRVGEHVEIDLGDEVVRTDATVVTAGAWVGSVLDGTLTLPSLTVTQEQVVHFIPRDPGVAWPSFIHHGQPAHYGLLTPGEGVKVGGHHQGPTTTGDGRDYEIDPARVADAVAYAERWIPGVEPVPQFGVTCLYTTTANEDFLLDRIGPVIVGSPCSGHGFKFTPLIGRMLADLAMEPSTADVHPRHRLAAFI
ncbi:MAG: FAD-dependent oxidoreductase [Ilumatobacteraceae bacterium]